MSQRHFHPSNPVPHLPSTPSISRSYTYATAELSWIFLYLVLLTWPSSPLSARLSACLDMASAPSLIALPTSLSSHSFSSQILGWSFYNINLTMSLSGWKKKKKKKEEEEVVECKKKCWHCSQGVGRVKGMTSESTVISVGWSEESQILVGCTLSFSFI